MPWACAASRQRASHDTIGARPGTRRARVSLARSLVPMTKPASRVSESCASAASALMLKIASGVSIIAQTRVFRSHFMSSRRWPTRSSCFDPADLGHQDPVRPGVGGGVEIVGMPGRVDAVDPDEHLALTEAAGLHRVGDLLAGLLLGLGRHRVLEIEDHAIGRQRAGLFDGAGVRSRHVEHAAARTKGHGSPPGWYT